jgi:hypothetical protein
MQRRPGLEQWLRLHMWIPHTFHSAKETAGKEGMYESVCIRIEAIP